MTGAVRDGGLQVEDQNVVVENLKGWWRHNQQIVLVKLITVIAFEDVTTNIF